MPENAERVRAASAWALREFAPAVMTVPAVGAACASFLQEQVRCAVHAFGSFAALFCCTLAQCMPCTAHAASIWHSSAWRRTNKYVPIVGFGAVCRCAVLLSPITVVELRFSILVQSDAGALLRLARERHTSSDAAADTSDELACTVTCFFGSISDRLLQADADAARSEFVASARELCLLLHAPQQTRAAAAAASCAVAAFIQHAARLPRHQLLEVVSAAVSGLVELAARQSIDAPPMICLVLAALEHACTDCKAAATALCQASHLLTGTHQHDSSICQRLRLWAREAGTAAAVVARAPARHWSLQALNSHDCDAHGFAVHHDAGSRACGTALPPSTAVVTSSILVACLTSARHKLRSALDSYSLTQLTELSKTFTA